METSEEILKNALNVNHTLFIINTVIAYQGGYKKHLFLVPSIKCGHTLNAPC